MLTVRFAKTKNMRFIPHVDLMRTITRTVLRADINIKYSAGYNPHALLFLTSPMPIGIASCAEYMMLETQGDTDNFVERFNKVAPEGLFAINCFNTLKNPKLAAKIVEADYSFFVSAIDKKNEIEDILNGFEIKTLKKGESVVFEAKDKIKKIEVLKDRINLRLAAGNAPLRADRLAENINEKFNLDIKIPQILKSEQYVFENELMLVDKYLESLV